MVAYGLADRCTNVITPGNAYLIIILAVLRRYMPTAGLGTNHHTDNCRRTLAILVAWTAQRELCIWLDIPLVPAGPLHYPGR